MTTSRQIRAWCGRIHLLAMVIAILVSGVWAMDHLTTIGSERDGDGDGDGDGRRANHHEGRARVFVLLIDSLRYETAIDPERMPHLSALRERGVHARVTSSRDAITVSAIREMFTGRERFLAFGFVRDFITGRESTESLFTQLRLAGVPVRVDPPYAFEQFADDIPPLDPSLAIDDEVEDRDEAGQNRFVRSGLAHFVAGEADFVVTHIVYGDRAAHDYGIHGRPYAEIHRRIDELVGEIDVAIAPSDTFVVAGDHGHTDNGRHSLGLDVPSFALYRGVAFNQGVSLGTIPIAEHRWLMSWAMKLPVQGGYDGSRHPQALSASAALPRAYARPASAEEMSERVRVPQGAAWQFWLLAIDLGLLFGLWLALAWRKVGDPRCVAIGFWLAIAGLGALVVSTWLLAVPVAVAVALWALQWRAGRHTPVAWGVLASVGGAGIHWWGRLLAAHRDVVHEPSFDDLQRYAAMAIVITAMASYRVGATRAAWLALGVIGALGYPTVYRYGAMPGLVTMWLCWVAAVLVDARHVLGHARSWALSAAMAVGVFLLIQPFAFADAGNFALHTWRPWLWSLMPHGHDAWVTTTLLVKLIVLFRWQGTHLTKALAVCATWQVWRVQWGAWHPSDGGYVALIVALGLAGAVAPRLTSREIARELRHVCWLWAMYLGYYYVIRIPNDHYMWADCFLAALVLSARLVERSAPAHARRQHYAILMMLALVVAGWVTVAWTLHLYEWKVLYAWFDAAFIERHALWFIPFINGRYLIPLLMARMLLHDDLGERIRYPERTVWTAGGAKLVSLACIISGLGWAIADSEVYLESIGEAAIFMVLAVGLL